MNDAGYQSIPLGSIHEPGHQLRERIDQDELGALADSIGQAGLLQPIGLRGPLADGKYEIVWGHRRYLACRILRHATIPARVFAAEYDPLLAALSENLHRHDLNPVEEAAAVQKFLDRGASRAEIARLFRRSAAWVEQRVALLSLPEDVRDAVRAGKLGLAVAAALADVDHEPYRRQLIYEAVAHGATAATAMVWRQHYLADRDRIVHNTVTIDRFIEERARFVVKYPCDWCDDEHPYTETRTVRLCLTCADQLDQAKAGAAAGAGPGPG